MQSRRLFVTYFQGCRCISSSNVYSNSNRESRFINKLMHGTKKSKRIWYDTSTDIYNATNIINPVNKSLSVSTVRRMNVRNKLFMEHITDLMSMEELSDIVNGNIEITHVKITADYKCVNIFWIPVNDNVSSCISEEALQKCARIIRHKLSQLRIIGVVPPIQFVKNKQFSMQKKVEEKLTILGLHDSSSYSEQMQLTVSNHNAISQIPHKKLTDHDSENDKSHIELPLMRHDVLGLDHHKIMSQIIVSKSKSKMATQRWMNANVNTNTDSNSYDSALNKITNNFLSQEEQQKIFSEFLTKRRIEEKRRHMKRSHEQELLNNFEEIDSEDDDSTYSDEFNDKYNDEVTDNI